MMGLSRRSPVEAFLFRPICLYRCMYARKDLEMCRIEAVNVYGWM